MGITVGNIEYPLDPFVNVIREVADPSLQILGDLIFAGIYADCNFAYQQVVPDGYIVLQFIPTNPEPYLSLQEYLKFPFLAIWRDSYIINNRTLSQKQRTSSWKIQYCLGECALTREINLIGFLNAVSGSIESIIDNSCSHSAYNDGYANINSLGFTSINIVKSQIGIWSLTIDDSQTAIRYPILTIDLQTTELIGFKLDNTTSSNLEEISMRITDVDGYEILETLDTDLYVI
jgi:hypothetical protein